jgi:hypothetical protein
MKGAGRITVLADDYQRILDRCGGQQRVLANRVRARLLKTWREAFAIGLFRAKGRWKYHGFDWHVFSFEYARAFHGERAVVAYAAEETTGKEEPARPGAIVVCPEGRDLAAVQIVGGSLPDFRPEYADVLVWPDDLAWTMALTHERSLGPYFCRREWVDAALVKEPRKRR